MINTMTSDTKTSGTSQRGKTKGRPKKLDTQQRTSACTSVGWHELKTTSLVKHGKRGPAKRVKGGATRRSGHTATYFADAVWTFGGLGGSAKLVEQDRVFERLCLRTLCWQRVVPSGPEPSPRASHAACSLGAALYIFGGSNGLHHFSDLWRYDFELRLWERIIHAGYNPGTEVEGERAPSSRYGHSLVGANGSSLVLFAGTVGTQYSNEVWVFSLAERSWDLIDAVGAVPEPRSHQTATFVQKSGKL